MKIFIFFVGLYAIILTIKILANLKIRNKHFSKKGNYSINAKFNDSEISLSEALENFNNN